MPVAKTKGQKTRNDLIAGAIGGTVGTMLNTPFDVVKSRIQSVDAVSSAVKNTTGAYLRYWSYTVKKASEHCTKVSSPKYVD